MIAKQVPYVQRQLARDVRVVTGDVGLKTRCQQKSVHARSLSVVESASLLDAFDEAARTEEPLPALAPLVAEGAEGGGDGGGGGCPAAWRWGGGAGGARPRGLDPRRAAPRRGPAQKGGSRKKRTS